MARIKKRARKASEGKKAKKSLRTDVADVKLPSKAVRVEALVQGVNGPEAEANRSKGKKHHRYRKGTVALRQIRRFQSTRKREGSMLLIPKIKFQRLVREVAHDFN